MALKTIMLRKRLTDAQKRNAELRTALKAFDTREAEIAQAIEDAETEEQRSAVESEVNNFETERRAAAEAVTSSDEEIANIQRELEEAEQAQDEALGGNDNNGGEARSRQRGDDHMHTMELREAQTFQRTGKHTFQDVRSMVRAAVTTGTAGVIGPVGVGGINGTPVVSSLIDMIKITDCTGMAGYKVAYLDADTAAAAATTQGNVPTEGEPTFGAVEFTPTNYATIGYIHKEVRKQSPLLYAEAVEAGARRSLRRKLNSVAVTAITGSTLNDTLALTGASGADLFDATLLGKIILGYGGDEDLNGAGVLFLNKKDLAAFNSVRGSNEYLPVYSIVPDASNPNTGVIKDNNGLSCRYCISKDVTALADLTLNSTAKKTMFYGVPTSAELALWGGYEVEVNEGYKFGEGLLTIRGDVTGDVKVSVKHGFLVVTAKAS